MLVKNKSSFSVKSITAVGFSLLAYTPLVNGYFAHDEWITFFTYFKLDQQPLVQAIGSYLVPRPGQFAPLSNALAYTLFHFFSLNYLAFFVCGLLLHGLTGVVLIMFLDRLTGKKNLAILGGVFFVLAPHHFQATSWVVANIGYSLAALLLLVGLIWYFEWLKTNKKMAAVLASLLLFSSVFAKEITIYIFLALPVLAFIWTGDVRKSVKSLLIALPGYLFIIWHYLFIKSNPVVDYSAAASLSIVNVITLPLRSVAQSVVPQHGIYFLAKLLLLLFPPYTLDKLQTTKFNVAVETVGAGSIVALLIIGVIWLGVYLFRKYYRTRDKNVVKLYAVGILLTACSGLPYIFVDSKAFALLQPRYVYTGVLTATIALAPVLYLGVKKWKKNFFIAICGVLLVLFGMTWSMAKEMGDMNAERKNILVAIGQTVKNDSKNSVIYTKSDTSFYGMADDVKILPFQAGAGKVIAAYLYANNKIYLPEDLYDPKVLGALESQGFYSDEVGSFGYFRDLDSLKKAIREKKINLNNVYAFEYNSKTKSIKPISLVLQ